MSTRILVHHDRFAMDAAIALPMVGASLVQGRSAMDMGVQSAADTGVWVGVQGDAGDRGIRMGGGGACFGL